MSIQKIEFNRYDRNTVQYQKGNIHAHQKAKDYQKRQAVNVDNKLRNKQHKLKSGLEQRKCNLPYF